MKDSRILRELYCFYLLIEIALLYVCSGYLKAWRWLLLRTPACVWEVRGYRSFKRCVLLLMFKFIVKQLDKCK